LVTTKEKTTPLAGTKMRIAILSYSFPPKMGGGEIMVSNLASYLSEKGNDVFIIGNCEGSMETHKNYFVFRTPSVCCESVSRIAHLLVGPFMLLSLHLKNKIDVIHVAGLTDLFVALPIKLTHRVPIVLRLSTWKDPSIVNRLKKLVSFTADVIIALNSSMSAEMARGGFNENQIVTIFNGVSINKFTPSLKDRPKIVMLWVGRLDSGKRPHWAIEVLSLVKKKYNNVSLQIVGKGNNEEQLRKLISRCGLHDSVSFLGYLSNSAIAEIMRNADIFLLTSKGEGMSNALLEAMACGLVVVTTSASSIDVVQNGVNGFTAKNPEDMASIVLRLIDDEVLKRKIGENARRTVLEKFSTDRMFSAYLQLYKKLTRK
jgi:glycosyltransferase involved in cell wall biosynthesis